MVGKGRPVKEDGIHMINSITARKAKKGVDGQAINRLRKAHDSEYSLCATDFWYWATNFIRTDDEENQCIRYFPDFKYLRDYYQDIEDNQFVKLTETAEELGRTTFFTATQVAELQLAFSKLGFNTQEILDAQGATLALATATGTDLERAAQVAGASVRGFGLDASETQRVVDVATSPCDLGDICRDLK